VPGDVETLTITTETRDATAVLRPSGVLNGLTYRSLRDVIIKTALEEPRAVVVDVTELSVPAESALVVFTSAKWHVGRWPEVAVVVACEHTGGRSALARNGVTRYVPVYPSVGAAIAALSADEPPAGRRRVRASLPARFASLQRARDFVTECLSAWHKPELIAVTKVVVTTLVENVLAHTDSGPCVRLEFNGSAVTVAVADDSPTPASLLEDREAAGPPSGLAIVAALSRMWGNAPTPSGKTVWAVLGPENRL
jgi:hypothetical protein